MSLFVLTGWTLASGTPIFLQQNGDYDVNWYAALVFEEDSQEVLLSKAKQAAKEGKIVDPYCIEVVPSDTHYYPIKKKEQLRLQGPSVRADLQVPALLRDQNSKQRERD
jgi:hypothetical protein